MPPALQLDVSADWLSVTTGQLELCRYVYRPDLPAIESPQPYFHPVRTLAGNVITLHRPHDHPWHKGIALSLPNVADANFWGGGMVLRGSDGEMRDVLNNGVQQHDGFDQCTVTDDVARIAERLTWITEHGEHWISERRDMSIHLVSEHEAWVLSFRTALTNTRGTAIEFGSPTTNGRPDAGYSGLFWRGPREFTWGSIIVADGPECPGGPFGSDGSEAMGARGRWLAYTGQHDGHHGYSTVMFVDDTSNIRHPAKWFVRSRPYACVCPAPFFDEVYTLPASGTLTLSYDVVIADGAWDRKQVDEVIGHDTSNK